LERLFQLTEQMKERESLSEVQDKMSVQTPNIEEIAVSAKGEPNG